MTQLGLIAERGTAYTTAPVTGSPVFDPEYLDVAGVYYLFGIKKGLVYQLLKEQKIQSVSLRRDEGASGKRLINIASLRAFLKSQEGK